MKAIGERVDVPLEREARKAMMRADRSLRELDTDEGDEDSSKKSRRRKRNQRQDDDVVLDEAFNVLSDLIRLNAGAELPPPRLSWLEAFQAL